MNLILPTFFIWYEIIFIQSEIALQPELNYSLLNCTQHVQELTKFYQFNWVYITQYMYQWIMMVKFCSYQNNSFMPIQDFEIFFHQLHTIVCLNYQNYSLFTWSTCTSHIWINQTKSNNHCRIHVLKKWNKPNSADCQQ